MVVGTFTVRKILKEWCLFYFGFKPTLALIENPVHINSAKKGLTAVTQQNLEFGVCKKSFVKLVCKNWLSQNFSNVNSQFAE